jgi:hypothetical protein
MAAVGDVKFVAPASYAAIFFGFIGGVRLEEGTMRSCSYNTLPEDFACATIIQ